MKNSRLGEIPEEMGGSHGRARRTPCQTISVEASGGRDSFSDTELQQRAGFARLAFPPNRIPQPDVTNSDSIVSPTKTTSTSLPASGGDSFLQEIVIYFFLPLSLHLANSPSLQVEADACFAPINTVTHEGSRGQGGGRRGEDHKRGQFLQPQRGHFLEEWEHLRAFDCLLLVRSWSVFSTSAFLGQISAASCWRSGISSRRNLCRGPTNILQSRRRCRPETAAERGGKSLYFWVRFMFPPPPTAGGDPEQVETSACLFKTKTPQTTTFN